VRLANEQEAAAGGTAAQIVLGQVPDRGDFSGDDPPTSAQSDCEAARRRMTELLRQEFDQRTWRMFWETAVVGREPADIADEMGVSKWAVYKARARVLQRLQQEMNGLE
ncbi:MAG: sigma-70 family RNA polymerase sigma factor, partial [Planctomycetales bacterium]|nr:sigma-70 family RNA polymerase sigma factor [Planctomycetales bacterium]